MNANSSASSAAGRLARFSLAALAAWRVTHLLTAEDGPAGIVARARGRLGSGPAGELADCFGCMSMWVAIPLVPFVTRRPAEAPVCWLALSGAAFLLERLGSDAESVITLDPVAGDCAAQAADENADDNEEA